MPSTPLSEVKVENLSLERQAALQSTITDRLFTKYELTCLQKMLGMGGFGLGVLAAYYELALGASFGDKITSAQVKALPAAPLLISGFFALHAALPAAALVGLPTRDYCIALADSSGKKKYVRPSRYPRLKKALDRMTDALSWSSGTPFAYQLCIIFTGNLPAQIAFASASILIGFPTSRLGLNGLYMNRFNDRFSQEPEFIRDKRARLARKFREILAKVKAAEAAAIDRLYQFYSQSPDQDKGDQAFFTTIKRSLGVGNELVPEEPVPPVTWGKWLMDGFGLAVGTVASYTLADLSIAAVSLFCDLVGLENVYGRAAFQYSYALTSTFPNCVFLSTFAQMRCEDIYYHCTQANFRPFVETSRPRLRRFLHGYSFLIGALAATPNVDLALEQGSGSSSVGIPFAFLGVALAQSKAIDLLLQNIINYCDSKFAPNSPAFHRDALIQIINLLLVEINYNLSPEELIHFEQEFFREPAQQEVKQEAKQGPAAPGASGAVPLERPAVPPVLPAHKVDLDSLPETEEPENMEDEPVALKTQALPAPTTPRTAATPGGLSPRRALSFFPSAEGSVPAPRSTLVQTQDPCKIQGPG